MLWSHSSATAQNVADFAQIYNLYMQTGKIQDFFGQQIIVTNFICAFSVFYRIFFCKIIETEIFYVCGSAMDGFLLSAFVKNSGQHSIGKLEFSMSLLSSKRTFHHVH